MLTAVKNHLFQNQVNNLLIVCMVYTSAEYGSTGYGCQPFLWSGEREKWFFFLSPFAPENLASRDEFSRPVPRQSAHSPYSCRIWCLLTGFLLLSATGSICTVNRHRVSPELKKVTRLRTDGFTAESPPAQGHSHQGRLSNGCCLFRYHHRPIFCAPLFGIRGGHA